MPPTRTRKKAKASDEEDNNSDKEEEQSVKRQTSFSKHGTQWIFFMQDSVLQHDPNVENKPAVCPLRHPKTGEKALYLFSNEDRDIQEVIQLKEECRSWFINETIQYDGSLYITTDIDPIFLVLPYLIKGAESGKYMTIDQLVTDSDFPECQRLLSTSGLAELYQVAGVKGDDDLRAYRYDKDKTLSWLKLKVEKVARVLERKNICVSGARSAEFIKSNKEAYSKDDLMRYAFGMVSDYLSLDLSAGLREYLGIPAVVEKRPSDAKNPPSKRAKLEDITPTEDYSKNGKVETAPKAKMTAAQKKLDQVDKKGMKSMMSFFSPKPKA